MAPEDYKEIRINSTRIRLTHSVWRVVKAPNLGDKMPENPIFDNVLPKKKGTKQSIISNKAVIYASKMNFTL